MRKIVTIIVSLAAILCFFILSPAAAEFKDIKGHKAEKEISKWVEKGIAFGYSKNYFKPDNAITKAEFAAMVNKAFGFKKLAKVNFCDVTSKNKYEKEIKKAVAAGYMSGLKNGQFRPNNRVTRQDAAVMFAKILKRDTTNTDEVIKFKDYKTILTKYRGSVNAVVAKDYMTEYEDNTFRPNQYLTRADLVVILDRIFSDASGEDSKLETITEIKANNGTINIKLSDNVPGITSKDLEVTAKLDGKDYNLENLVFDEKNNSFTFKKVPLTYSEQKLEITVSGSAASKKVQGSKIAVVNIDRIFIGGGGSSGGSSQSSVVSIDITGNDLIDLSLEDSIAVTYNAVVRDQYDSTMSGEKVLWKLEAHVEGVSVNSTTGQVTVNNVVSAKSFTLVAMSLTKNSITKTKKINLNKRMDGWKVTRPLDNLLVSEFKLKNISDKDASYYALFTFSGDQIDTVKKVQNEDITTASVIFCDMSKLFIKFYKDSDMTILVGMATFNGTVTDGKGSGTLTFVAGTWILTEPYENAIVSDLTIAITGLSNVSYYEAWYGNNMLSVRLPAAGSGNSFRSIKQLFSDPSKLTIKFYGSATGGEPIGDAIMNGAAPNGKGAGNLIL